MLLRHINPNVEMGEDARNKPEHPVVTAEVSIITYSVDPGQLPAERLYIRRSAI